MAGTDIDMHAIMEHCLAHGGDEPLPQGVLPHASGKQLDHVANMLDAGGFHADAPICAVLCGSAADRTDHCNRWSLCRAIRLSALISLVVAIPGDRGAAQATRAASVKPRVRGTQRPPGTFK